MIDKRDMQLLAHIRHNSRMKLTEIGKSSSMPVSTIFEKMNGVMESYIQRYTCILNTAALGYTSRATIILKVDKAQKKEIGDYLERHEHVNSLFKINNGYDFLMDVIFQTMAELEEFVEALEARYHIKQKDVYFIIDEVKQEGFLANPLTAIAAPNQEKRP